MANVDMEYWRDDPKDWLIDERLAELTPEEFMGFFWIFQRGRTCKPPGVMPGDEATLQRWSRLKESAWKRCREKILSFFDVDTQGRLHHEATKKEFRSYVEVVHRRKLDATSKANLRWKGKKIVGADKNIQALPRFEDPYQGFGQVTGVAGGTVSPQSGLFNPKMQMHATACSGNAVAESHQIDRSTERRDLSGAAPPGLAAAASLEPPSPLDETSGQTAAEVGRTALAKAKAPRLSPEEFAAKQAQTLKTIEQIAGGGEGG